jgi:hypothetical protein
MSSETRLQDVEKESTGKIPKEDMRQSIIYYLMAWMIIFFQQRALFWVCDKWYMTSNGTPRISGSSLPLGYEDHMGQLPEGT